MGDNKTLEVLRSIAEASLGSPLNVSSPLTGQVKENDWKKKLGRALRDELGVQLSANEIESGASLFDLSKLIESRLGKDQTGRSLIEVYTALERFVRQELSHDVHYHWYAKWKGDLIKSSDSLDDVEILLRVEQTFGFSIPDRDIEAMDTVAHTVRYILQRSSKQTFMMRPRPESVCPGEFIFHELRRLLIIRGGVPRAAVRLDTRLGDLLPTWYFHFWKEIQSSFGVSIPHGNLLSRSLGLEKRTTIKELIVLITSANN
jgi:acyl carrier protein